MANQSFGGGLVSGLGIGTAIGTAYSDAWKEQDSDDIAKAGVTKDEEVAAEVPVEPVEGATTEIKPQAAPEAPADKPAQKQERWKIGDGDTQKIFDHDPSDDEIKDWRYSTMLQKVGHKQANDWMAAENVRERDRIVTKNAKLGETDMDDVRSASVAQEKADQALAANGGEYNITEGGAGMRPDPTSRYRLQVKQAEVYRRSNPDQYEKMMKSANGDAAGLIIAAYNKGDVSTMKQLYNVFPNDHLISSVKIDDKGSVIATDSRGKVQTIPKNQFIQGVMAHADPKLAVTAMANEDKAAATEKQRAIDNERHKDELARRDRNDMVRLVAGNNRGGAGTGAGGGTGGKDNADPGEGGWIDYKEVATALPVYATTGPDGEKGYAASVSDTRRGTFNPDAVVENANLLYKYARDGGTKLSSTEAINLSARVLAANSVKQTINNEIAAAKGDTTKVAALTKELNELPKVLYRFRPDDSIERVYQQGGMNASTRVLGVVNPSQSFDASSDPALAETIVNRFSTAPNWAGYAKTIAGDGTKNADPKVQAQVEKERADQFSATAVTAAQEGAVARGLSPEKQKESGQLAAQQVAKIARFYNVYKPVAEQAKKAQDAKNAENLAKESRAKSAVGNTQAQPRSAEVNAVLGLDPNAGFDLVGKVRTALTPSPEAQAKFEAIRPQLDADIAMRNLAGNMRNGRVSNTDAAAMLKHIANFPELQKKYGISDAQIKAMQSLSR